MEEVLASVFTQFPPLWYRTDSLTHCWSELLLQRVIFPFPKESCITWLWQSWESPSLGGDCEQPWAASLTSPGWASKLSALRWAWSIGARITQSYSDVLPKTATALALNSFEIKPSWVYSFGVKGRKSVVQLKKKERGVDSVEHY